MATSYNGGVFSKVEYERPGRSVFDLSYSKIFDTDFGLLYPVMCDELSPGMFWKIKAMAKVRVMPMQAPVFGSIKLFAHYFFVPYRLLWDDSKTENWEQFITGGEYEPGKFDTYDGLTDIALPRWYPENTHKHSLWDSFGFPVGVNPTLNSGFAPIDFPRRAYNLVYNEFYRDENLVDEVPLSNENILLRARTKDYFNTALPWQQKGNPIALPISTTGKVVFDTTSVQHLYEKAKLQSSSGSVVMNNVNLVPVRASESGDTLSSLVGTLGIETSLTANLSANTKNPVVADIVNTDLKNFLNQKMDNHLEAVSTSFTIADLRMAFQLQKWMERNARAGNRYIEYLKANFAVAPKDERLQRPEYIGGMQMPVIVSEVLQTSESTSSSPQGNMSGHGIGAGKNTIGSYYADEYGLIIGIMSIMPNQLYQQGINRQWLRQSRYDFYNPVFANLSEQAIYNAEIYAQGNGTPDDDNDAQTDFGKFGFQGRYDELRYKPNIVTGNLRDTLDYWHMGRKFDALPKLNEAFIEQNPLETKKIFMEQTEPPFIVEYYNLIRAVQPMPYHAQPGLIDHF